MNVDKLINSYFLLIEAADLALRTAIKQQELNEMGLNKRVGIRQSTKIAHNRMMQAAKTFSHNYALCYDTFYEDTFKKFESWDELRREANLVVRIVLLMGDRAYNSIEIEQQIEEYITSLPKRSEMNEKLLELFMMR